MSIFLELHRQSLLLLYSHMQIHTERITTTQRKRTSENFFRKICTSHFIVRVRKGLLRVFPVWGSWRPNITAIYWPPLLWQLVLCLSRSEAQGPSFLLSAGFLYHILSPTGLVPKLHQESRGPLRPGVAFPTTSCLRRLWSPTGLQFPALNELYNSSTSTQSPT